jgi:hypothetical protein
MMREENGKRRVRSTDMCHFYMTNIAVRQESPSRDSNSSICAVFNAGVSDSLE